MIFTTVEHKNESPITIGMEWRT